MNPLSSRNFMRVSAGVILLAFALRVHRLDAQSLWWDEIAGAVIAQLPYPQWLEPVFQDRGFPPGFYFLLHYWAQAGASEFFLRFFPTLCGTLSTAILLRVGARVGGARVGILAALLMALSPTYIWYSQELRMYAPLILAILASSWAFLELLRRPRLSVTLGLALVDVFGLYLHYLFGIYLLTQLVFLVMARGRYSRALRMWAAATFGAGMLFFPWVVALQLAVIQGRPNLDWIPNAQWLEPALSLYGMLVGATLDPALVIGWAAAAIGLGLALYGARQGLRGAQREAVRFLLTWLLLPFLFLFLISMPVPGRSLYVDRYLTPFAPALLLLIALGAAELYRRQRVVLGVAAVVAIIPIGLSLANVYEEPRYARDDWRSVSHYLTENGNPQREAVLLDLSEYLPFDYYNGAQWTRVERPFADAEGSETWFDMQSGLQKYARLWVITVAYPPSAHRLFPDAAGQQAFAKRDPFKRALDARLQVESERWFPGLVLTAYRVSP